MAGESLRDEAEQPSLNISPGAVIGGKYRLKSPLRQGGMGSVWVATHLSLDTSVAVKFMLNTPPTTAEAGSDGGSGKGKATPSSSMTVESRGRFEREAKVVAAIRSANVVQVLDYGIDQGAQYIVMELLDGEDLGAHLKRVGRMPIHEVSRLVVAVARALQRAHDAGLVHRDLKPPNVFLAKEGDEMVPKVLDFGVAKALVRDQAVGEGTVEGTLVGTPWYMSPEQARARSNIDHRADLWSLGVIIYRALTGVRPFESESLLELVVQICSQSPVPPSKVNPSLPPALDEFMAKALDRDPDKRFQSAREMSRALVAIAPVHATVPPPRDASGIHDDVTRPVAIPRESSDDILTVAAPMEDTPPSEPRLPAAPVAPAPVAAPASPAASRVRVLVVAALSGVFLALAVSGGLLIWTSRNRTQHDPVKPATSSAPVAAASSVAVPIAAPSVSIAPPPAISASVAVPVPSASAAPSAKVVKPPPPKVDCSTPFYWDKNGTKFIKPQCL